MRGKSANWRRSTSYSTSWRRSSIDCLRRSRCACATRGARRPGAGTRSRLSNRSRVARPTMPRLSSHCAPGIWAPCAADGSARTPRRLTRCCGSCAIAPTHHRACRSSCLGGERRGASVGIPLRASGLTAARDHPLGGLADEADAMPHRPSLLGAVRAARKEAGRPLSLGECLERIARHFIENGGRFFGRRPPRNVVVSSPPAGPRTPKAEAK